MPEGVNRPIGSELLKVVITQVQTRRERGFSCAPHMASGPFARWISAPRFAVFALGALLILGPGLAQAQSAADAALNMANMLDGAGGGVSSDDLMAALEGAAEAGQPIALYRLGMMYENGDGVDKDPVKAFGYFSQIANEHADTPPRSLEADIVAQSFVKVGEYYRDGLPGAGITADNDRSHALLMHAASYFGDADAQFRLGKLYLEDSDLGINPLQGARWLSLAARKGHGPAQAVLGSMLFNGEGIGAQPIEGLMWLTLAQQGTRGTPNEGWIGELVNGAMSLASPEQRAEAIKRAGEVGTQIRPRDAAVAVR